MYRWLVNLFVSSGLCQRSVCFRGLSVQVFMSFFFFVSPTTLCAISPLSAYWHQTSHYPAHIHTPKIQIHSGLTWRSVREEGIAQQQCPIATGADHSSLPEQKASQWQTSKACLRYDELDCTKPWHDSYLLPKETGSSLWAPGSRILIKKDPQKGIIPSSYQPIICFCTKWKLPSGS